MKLSHTLPITVIALMFAGTMPANAVPVSYSFSGTADEMTWVGEAGQPFDGNFPWGEIATGSLTFDLDFGSVGFSSANALFVRSASSAFAGLSITMPTFPAVGVLGSAGSDCNDPFSSFRIADDEPNAAMPMTPAPADQFRLELTCNQEVAPGVTAARSLYFELLDTEDNLNLVSGLDPAQALDLSLASSARFGIGYSLIDSNSILESWTIGFQLESLSSVVSVPEPATCLLLMVGLTGCIIGRRGAGVTRS